MKSQSGRIEIPFPYRGIDTNGQNDLTVARYIQNMIVGDNKTGQVRYGTQFIANHAFDANRKFTDPIEVINYFRSDGTTQQLIYQLYLTRIQFLDIVTKVTIAPCIDNIACSTLTLDLTTYNTQEKAYFSKIFFEEVYLFVKQDNSNGAYIHDVVFSNNGNTLTFNISFNPNFFELNLSGDNNFELWIERGGLYKKKSDNSYELLVDNLDPNVVISSVTFMNKLLIANGVDPVKIYDGTQIVDLKSPATFSIKDDLITINLQNIEFDIPEELEQILREDLKVGDTITLVKDNENNATVNYDRTILSINFAAPVNNYIKVTIGLNQAADIKTRGVIYNKLCPSFSYLAVAKRRLWALPPGRSYKNKFRPPELAMKAYYADKVESINDWFAAGTNVIAVINGDFNNQGFQDNWEVIKSFGDKVLFIGRDTMQVWSGFDPSLTNNLLPDFIHEDTITTGIYQKKLIQEVPNNLVFVSKIGFATAKLDSLTQQVIVSYNFGLPIDYHLKNQITFIANEKDYRSMVSFIYPFGRFLGFKIKYSCLIYQLNDVGAWTIFTGSFTNATSYCYDPISKDLYMATDNSNLLIYADKIDKRLYEDYDLGKISWIISYNWTYLGNTWFNAYIYFIARTLKNITVNIRIFVDNDQSISFREYLEIKQEGVLYDTGKFNLSKFAAAETGVFFTITRFIADFLMLDIDGLSNDQFIIDKIFLTGGVQGN